jgi:hypothetical protein
MIELDLSHLASQASGGQSGTILYLKRIGALFPIQSLEIIVSGTDETQQLASRAFIYQVLQARRY